MQTWVGIGYYNSSKKMLSIPSDVLKDSYTAHVKCLCHKEKKKKDVKPSFKMPEWPLRPY